MHPRRPASATWPRYHGPMRFTQTRRRAVFVGLVLAVGLTVAIVGFHAHSHSHGDLRVIDAEGNVQVLGAWRLGSAAGGELPAVPSGDLRFELSNADGVRHTFVVVRTDVEGAALPVSKGRVDLEAAGELVGTVDTVLPGGSAGRTFTLPPGQYVLYCDIAGHYEGGMYYTLRVEESASLARR